MLYLKNLENFKYQLWIVFNKIHFSMSILYFKAPDGSKEKEEGKNLI